MTPSDFLARARGHWQTLNAREQTLVFAASGLVALALLWWVGIAPALNVLRQADARQRSLDDQLQQIQGLAAEARALQSRPAINHDEALRALESSVKQGLGPGAQLSVAGERATVTLRNVPAAALAQWLTQVRVNARALPGEARLVRGAAPADASGATWDGTVVLTLPPR